MASFSSIENIGGASWKFTPIGTAPFNYYLAGKLIIPESQADYVVVNHPTGNADEPPALEVTDTNDITEPESTLYPGFLTIQWEQVDVAAYYEVDRYEGSAWVNKGVIREQGLGYYKHITETIPDGSSEQWRVVAVDSEGNSSVALSMVFAMKCHPEPPGVAVAYDSGTGDITVSEA